MESSGGGQLGEFRIENHDADADDQEWFDAEVGETELEEEQEEESDARWSVVVGNLWHSCKEQDCSGLKRGQGVTQGVALLTLEGYDYSFIPFLEKIRDENWAHQTYLQPGVTEWFFEIPEEREEELFANVIAILEEDERLHGTLFSKNPKMHVPFPPMCAREIQRFSPADYDYLSVAAKTSEGWGLWHFMLKIPGR
jgi:hypothetical protein